MRQAEARREVGAGRSPIALQSLLVHDSAEALPGIGPGVTLILASIAVFALTLAAWRACLALSDTLERLTRPNP